LADERVYSTVETLEASLVSVVFSALSALPADASFEF